MPAYVIAEVTVTDLAGFEEYRKQVPATVAKYQGRFLVRGGDSPEYKDPKALRQRTAKAKILLIEGVA